VPDSDRMVQIEIFESPGQGGQVVVELPLHERVLRQARAAVRGGRPARVFVVFGDRRRFLFCNKDGERFGNAKKGPVWPPLPESGPVVRFAGLT